MVWDPSSWRKFFVLQMPDYDNKDLLKQVETELSLLPELVLSSEINELKRRLSSAAEGYYFILQAGECAESFSNCNLDYLDDMLKLFHDMNSMIFDKIKIPVINVARLAGQYGKPRSSLEETFEGVLIPSFRGEMVNSTVKNLFNRKPDPLRLLKGYYYSAMTMNLIRAINGQKIFNNGTKSDKNITCSDFFDDCYISHEALLLNYEEAFTRFDSNLQKYYNLSTHMLWLGERTRDIDLAHVEYLRGVANPIGIKVSSNISVDDLSKLLIRINPDNESGKIVLISRMGMDNIRACLPKLVEYTRDSGSKVLWLCDPMHGNTKELNINKGIIKTRYIENIKEELAEFFAIHKELGTVAGGIHLELTGKDVTECVSLDLEDKDNYFKKYDTLCDPRLNMNQSLDLVSWLCGNIL